MKRSVKAMGQMSIVPPARSMRVGADEVTRTSNYSRWSLVVVVGRWSLVGSCLKPALTRPQSVQVDHAVRQSEVDERVDETSSYADGECEPDWTATP